MIINIEVTEILLWQNFYGLASTVSESRWKHSAPQLNTITNTNKAIWKKKPKTTNSENSESCREFNPFTTDIGIYEKKKESVS